MKKQFVGFALFAFIVAATIISSGVFSISERFETFRADRWSKTSPPSSVAALERDAEAGKIAGNSPIVRQAVLNMNSKQLTLELIFKEPQRFAKGMPVILKFFRKDAKGIKFINSDKIVRIVDTFNYDSASAATIRLNNTYDWLEGLSRYDNLYVIAEAADDSASVQYDAAPTFDSHYAQPILLSWSK